MILTGHSSVADARRELLDAGYLHGFSSPGRPSLWAKANSKERDHRAILLVGGTWSIVPYPKPAGCLPREIPELQIRDKGHAYDADLDDDLSFLD